MTYDSSVVFSQYYSFPNTVLYLCMGHNLGVPKLNLHTVLYLCMAHNLGVPKLNLHTVLYLCMAQNLGVPKLNLHTVLYLCMAHNLGVPKLRDPNIYAMLQFNSVIQSLLFWLWHLNQLKIT